MSKRVKKAAIQRVKYALDHHAKPLKPIFEALQFALDGSGIMHRMDSRLGGANSNYIDYVDDTGTLHRVFLYGVLKPDPGIEVRTKVRGPVLVKLMGERDVLRWVASL